MRRPRVLVAAYYFPPVGGGGVTRTLHAVRGLAGAGLEPWVLTVDDAAWARDASRQAEVPPQARVLRLPNPDWGRVAAWVARRRGAAAPAAGAGAGRLRRLAVPDLHVGWSALAAGVASILTAVRAVDLVYSTSPPYSAAAVGALARALGVPWLADFRDGWTCCPTRADLPPRRVALERRMEDAVLQRADRVLFASEAVRARCAARVPGLAARSETLLTGYEPGEFAEARRTPAPAPDTLRIVHAGSLLGARREDTCARFLAALRTWLAREPEARVRVCFLGAEPAAAAALASAGLRDVLEVAPALARAALPAALAGSHLCLALQPPGPRGGDPVPGKLFDAAGAGRPVLGLAGPGAFADLVARLRLGAVCDPGDAEGVVRALSVAWRRVRRGESALPFDPGGARELSCARFASRLAALCTGLAAREGLPCPSPSAS